MVTRSVLLGTTAIAALGLAACNNSNDGFAGVAEAENGPFGYEVDEPVEVISATRGDGVAFDKFQVTFNNAEGTEITITTQEGEEIDFNLDDPGTWIGEDRQLIRGEPLARLVSAGGDKLEVMLGTVEVPVEPEPDNENGLRVIQAEAENEERLAYAMARLDENDTRDGFETYAVVGELTDPDNLPRYQEDLQVWDNDTEGWVDVSAGDLIEGTAYYNGFFIASVHRAGNEISNQASGDVNLSIDFADNSVDFNTENGEYRYDDLDDVAPMALTGVTPVYGTITDDQGNVIETFLADVVEVYDPITATGATANVVTSVSVTGTATVCSVTTCILPTPPIFPLPGLPGINTNTVIKSISAPTSPVSVSTALNPGGSEQVVTGLSLTTGQILNAAGDPVSQVVIGVTPIYGTENDDFYSISLSGSGTAADVSFDNGVTYTGGLEGFVEVSRDAIGNTRQAYVEGEFAGAIFGPGAGADTVDPGVVGEVVNATATAGTFEAGSDPFKDGYDSTIQIVGAFGAESNGMNVDDTRPIPEPPAVTE